MAICLTIGLGPRVKRALLFGKMIRQHIQKNAQLGCYVPPMRVERYNLLLDTAVNQASGARLLVGIAD